MNKRHAIITLAWSVAVLAALTLGDVYGFALGLASDPLQRTYAEYNHIRIYEDGSYTGQTLDGRQVTGCITGALCQD